MPPLPDQIQQRPGHPHGGTSVRLDDLPKLASPGSFQSVNPRAPAKSSAMYPVAATNRLTAGGARSSAGPRRNSVLESLPRTNAARTATASFFAGASVCRWRLALCDAIELVADIADVPPPFAHVLGQASCEKLAEDAALALLALMREVGLEV